MRVASYGDQTAEARQTAALAGGDGGRESRVLSDASAGSEAPADATSGTARASAPSARQQRYDELLRSAPPAAPAQPSLLDRMVAPLASALGMNRPKTPSPAPGAAVRSQPNPPARSVDPRSPERAPERAEDAAPRVDEPQEEQDPDTDLVPPKLQAAEFFPAQVQDGEETTLAVVVTDNLAGVRNVSGVVASPSGALTGFSCRREGDSSRYTARIVVPKAAAEGRWEVRYLTLSDNASNTVNLNAAQGALPPGAAFRVVSSSSDSKPPKLTGARLERIAMRAGERNTVFIVAEDDKAGVGQVSGLFVSPGKTARLGFGCKAGVGGMWECPLSPPNCLDCGLWELEQIQLKDNADNISSFRMDNPIVADLKLTISGDRCDAEPPVIQSLVLSPPVISNAEGGTIRIEALLAEDECGVAGINGQASPEGNIGGQRTHFSFEPSPDGRTFIGTIPVAKHSAKGVWTIVWLQAHDTGHNLRSYSTNDPVIARATFRVE